MTFTHEDLVLLLDLGRRHSAAATRRADYILKRMRNAEFPPDAEPVAGVSEDELKAWGLFTAGVVALFEVKVPLPTMTLSLQLLWMQAVEKEGDVMEQMSGDALRDMPTGGKPS